MIDWLTGWPTPPPPPWASYRALMACRLVALNKITGLHPVGIRETLFWALDKLSMVEYGDQAKTACGNFQLCSGFMGGIEGTTHAVVQSKMDRVLQRRREG